MGTKDFQVECNAQVNGIDALIESLEDVIVGQVHWSSFQHEVLTRHLTDPQSDDAALQRLIAKFRSFVLRLDKSQEYLVGSILRLNWQTRSCLLVEEFVSFLGDLLTAHTGYLPAVIKSLLANCAPSQQQLKNGTGSSIESYDYQFENVHRALKVVLNTIPLAGKILASSATTLFPYHGRETVTLECYVQNLLHISSYYPAVRELLLEVVMDNLIKIDVEIPKRMLEDTIEKEDLYQFSVEVDSIEEKGQEEATKLDKLLMILCNFIRKLCYPRDDRCIDWKVAQSLNQEVLVCFEKLLLPTHASSCVQFVIFYIASFNEYFVGTFLNTAWKVIQAPNYPSVLRQSAAAYLGSMIARGRFVTVTTAKQTLLLMCEWLHRYITLEDGSGIQADLCKHAAFYSIFQSVIYIFIFRHKQILSLPNGMDYCRGLNFERMVTSRLNPLKFCLRTVVDMFARITRMHEIVFCYTIIDRNNRSHLPVARGSTEIKDTARFQSILDTFFPFDPCLLPMMAKIIQPSYQEWEESSVFSSERLDHDSEDEVYSRVLKCGRSNDSSWSFMACSPVFDICISPGFQPAGILRQSEF